MNDSSIDKLTKKLWDFNKLGQILEKADCIIVLGSHDIRVAERGAELFLKGFAPVILFSGGFGRLTGDFKKPEAEVFADRAIELGVPRGKILIENKSTNTGENIDFSIRLLEIQGIKFEKIILVHKPYMERRAYATFRKHFPDIKVQITSPQIPYEKYPNKIISKREMINIIVGDTQRVKLYSEKGFSVKQEIPRQVWQAYEELVKKGFTTQLIK